ncbi:MAG TPA: tetratricopeptide repeat protein [Oscillatoriaceae cyanobacterium]
MTIEMPERDYYEILQVHPKASVAVIKKAYRTLLLEVHPDQGGSAEQTALITEAFKVLSDPERRTAYDRQYFTRAERDAADPSQTSHLVVVCPSCRTRNRVRSQELLSVARCSRCGHALSQLPKRFSRLAERLLARSHRLFASLVNIRLDKRRLGLAIALLVLSGAALSYALSDHHADPLAATDRLRAEGHFAQAAWLLQKAIDHEPANPRLHEILGDVYVKQNLYPQALAEYSEAIRLNPENSYLYTLQGDVYMQLKRPAEAVTSYAQALKIDPDETPALVALGNADAKQGHFSDAEALYLKALHQQPDADVYFNLGQVYHWDHNRGAAEKAFEQALIQDPEHRSSMVELASLYYEEGHYNLAAAQLVKANALQHHDLDLHLRLADIYERTGHKREAIQEWKVCLDQAKGNTAIARRAHQALTRLAPTG